MADHRRHEIEDAESLQRHLAAGDDLSSFVLQGVDLGAAADLPADRLRGAILLGCRFAGSQQQQQLIAAGARVFPPFDELPYQPYRSGLYSVDELLSGYDAGGYTGTLDFAIYEHAHRARSRPGGASIAEALAQRIHDHAIDDGLLEYLADHVGAGVVGVMGGHGMSRADPVYAAVAELGRQLTERGYLVVTGGGPGVMEAANLGAWLAGQRADAIDDAVGSLADAPTFDGGEREGTPPYLAAVQRYIAAAQAVVERLGSAAHGRSVAIPTWFYGHEPTNLFASAIAKYFDNSIREEGLLAIARAGVVYAPGSAGTMQEIFQDLTQNHYGTYGWRSPMVLFGSHRWRREHELIQSFAAARELGAAYREMITVCDDVDDVVRFIAEHPPRPVERRPPLYELIG